MGADSVKKSSGNIRTFCIGYPFTNAHLRGKIELAKIGEWSEQNSQLYFVPIEVLVIFQLLL